MLLTEGKQAQNQSLTYLNMSGAPSHALPLRRWLGLLISVFGAPEEWEGPDPVLLSFPKSRGVGSRGDGAGLPAHPVGPGIALLAPGQRPRGDVKPPLPNTACVPARPTAAAHSPALLPS